MIINEKNKEHEVNELFDHFLDKFILHNDSFLNNRKNILSLEKLKQTITKIKEINNREKNKKEDFLKEFNNNNNRLIFAHLLYLWHFGMNNQDISDITLKQMLSNYVEEINEKMIYNRNKVYFSGEYKTKFSNYFCLLAETFLEVKSQNLENIEKIKSYLEYRIKKDIKRKKIFIFNIILYFCYPIKYEPIASYNDKTNIVKAYDLMLEKADKDKDIDEKIKIIKKTKMKENPNFSFWNEKSFWKESKQKKSIKATNGSNANDNGKQIDFKNGEKIDIPLNQILYGPPGTGKTFHTINKTIEIIDNDFYNSYKEDTLENRKILKDRFDYFKKNRQIEFVTFHQSYGYEEFVEGIKPETKDKTDVIYETKPGIFKQICENSIEAPGKKDLEEFCKQSIDEKKNILEIKQNHSF